MLAHLHLRPPLDAVEILPRVYQGEMRRPHELELTLQDGQLLQALWGSEQKGVLCVPPLDLRIVPDSPADAIDRDESFLCEQMRPVIRPLLVDVVLTTLKRDRGREQYERAQP